MTNRNRSGFTLIELMLVVAIISILASVITPRISLLLQKAYQSTTKSNLGSIRSTIGIYYSDLQGQYPLAGFPNGFPDAVGESLTHALCPKYLQALPKPVLKAPFGFNGFLGLDFDFESKTNLDAALPLDIFIFGGAPGPAPGVNRPYVYDQGNGFVYLCNDNYETSGGTHFYEW